MSEAVPIINLEGITFSYPGGDTILSDLNFKFYSGERLGLVAPNGSGKTTLFHLIMGLVKPTAGQIELFGSRVSTEKDYTEVRHRIGFLFQDADDQLFSPTVQEDVAFGPLNMGKSEKEALEITKRALNYLGLQGFEHRITFKLSAGEKRLVALATVLAMEPEILLLDEPTSGLDQETKSRLEKILKELNMSFILISHDFDFLSETTDRIYTMENGKIVIDADLHFHIHKHLHPHGKVPHQHT